MEFQKGRVELEDNEIAAEKEPRDRPIVEQDEKPYTIAKIADDGTVTYHDPLDDPIVEQDDLEEYMILRWGCYHAVARCRDCDFIDEDYRTANKSAQEHCDKTGHKMTLESGYITNDGYRWGDP